MYFLFNRVLFKKIHLKELVRDQFRFRTEHFADVRLIWNTCLCSKVKRSVSLIIRLIDVESGKSRNCLQGFDAAVWGYVAECGLKRATSVSIRTMRVRLSRNSDVGGRSRCERSIVSFSFIERMKMAGTGSGVTDAVWVSRNAPMRNLFMLLKW